ncbi:MAG: hypothetical protein M1818_003892 [Claussenomyces sp. TS43310]|nr:MAG: hypothetical protein M1818_003892 [Claussenomyces sp. TS43310]
MLLNLAVLIWIFGLASALPPQKTLSPVNDHHDGPNAANARANANLIFNSIHSSMRQWGSSLQHNGMSFFLASIPEGTMLYHGRHDGERVTGMEWLAFEIEHAELFARRLGPPPVGNAKSSHRDQSASSGEPSLPNTSYSPFDGDEQAAPELPGYLHIYQTNRPLKRLLYIDGMSAGKSSMGTLDTQDHVLLNFTGENWMYDRKRARELCDLAQDWQIEGFIRMQAGFEIVMCDFSQGLDFVSALKRSKANDLNGLSEFDVFEWLRAAAARYDGIDGDRVVVDYSSMQSAYFYPLDLSDPDAPDSTLPRLRAVEPARLLRMKDDLHKILRTRQGSQVSINWQGVVDLIISRYADRLQFMATGPPHEIFVAELNHLLDTFIDYKSPSRDASIHRCSSHWLEPAAKTKAMFTDQDVLISAAVETVSRTLCQTLFDIRQTLMDGRGDAVVHPDLAVATIAAPAIRRLIDWLDWTVWKTCGVCAYDQICFVAIWPFGAPDDHVHPKCISATQIMERRGYWQMGRQPDP